MPDAEFESGSLSSFGNMTLHFPLKKGTSHQIRLFTPGSFMSRIVLLDPKLTPISISEILKQRNLSFSKFFRHLDVPPGLTGLNVNNMTDWETSIISVLSKPKSF